MAKYRAIAYHLEKTQPWSKKELQGYTYQERIFIRDIQISKKINKKNAIEFYLNYAIKSKKQKRKIRDKIIADVRATYPKHKKTSYRGINLKGKNHKLPSGKQPRQKEFSVNYDNFEDWNEQQLINNTTESKYYSYIVKRHEKHPNWSLEELRRGKIKSKRRVKRNE